jgi:hypothetical protein
MENEAKKALQELLETAQDRSAMARLREVYPEIEAAQKAGIQLEAILAALNERGGFDLTLKTFKTMLYRIRKKSKQESLGAKSDQEEKATKSRGVRLTPKKNVTPDDKNEKEDDSKNPFMKLSENKNGDARRTTFDYSPVPDKSKIYGDDET